MVNLGNKLQLRLALKKEENQQNCLYAGYDERNYMSPMTMTSIYSFRWNSCWSLGNCYIVFHLRYIPLSDFIHNVVSSKCV